MAWVKVQFKNENIFTHAFSFVLCTKLVTSICKVNKAAVRPVKVFIKNVTLVFRQLQFCKAKLEMYIKNRKFLKETW